MELDVDCKAELPDRDHEKGAVAAALLAQVQLERTSSLHSSPKDSDKEPLPTLDLLDSRKDAAGKSSCFESIDMKTCRGIINSESGKFMVQEGKVFPLFLSTDGQKHFGKSVGQLRNDGKILVNDGSCIDLRKTGALSILNDKSGKHVVLNTGISELDLGLVDAQIRQSRANQLDLLDKVDYGKSTVKGQIGAGWKNFMDGLFNQDNDYSQQEVSDTLANQSARIHRDIYGLISLANTCQDVMHSNELLEFKRDLISYRKLLGASRAVMLNDYDTQLVGEQLVSDTTQVIPNLIPNPAMASAVSTLAGTALEYSPRATREERALSFLRNAFTSGLSSGLTNNRLLATGSVGKSSVMNIKQAKEVVGKIGHLPQVKFGYNQAINNLGNIVANGTYEAAEKLAQGNEKSKQ